MGRKNLMLSLVSSARPNRVIVADPYPVIVHGVRKMVEDDPRLQVVGEAFTLAALQRKLFAQRPDVALVDWSMVAHDLAATTALLHSDLHTTSVIFLTVSENSAEKREMLRLGASAFVSKWTSARRLRSAVLKACQQRMPVAGQAAAAAGATYQSLATDAEQSIRRLTERERQLLPLVCGGLKNKEIGTRLGIAESTVWHHLTSIFSKLEVEDRLGLTIFAYGHRLVFANGGAEAGLVGARPVPVHADEARPPSILRVVERGLPRIPKYPVSSEAPGAGHRGRSLNA